MCISHKRILICYCTWCVEVKNDQERSKRSHVRWERLDWVMPSVRLNVILVDFAAYSASNCQHAGIPAFPPICPDLGTSAHWQTLMSSIFFLRKNLEKSLHRYLKLRAKSKPPHFWGSTTRLKSSKKIPKASRHLLDGATKVSTTTHYFKSNVPTVSSHVVTYNLCSISLWSCIQNLFCLQHWPPFLISGFNFHMFDESLLCRSFAFARGNTSG